MWSLWLPNDEVTHKASVIPSLECFPPVIFLKLGLDRNPAHFLGELVLILQLDFSLPLCSPCIRSVILQQMSPLLPQCLVEHQFFNLHPCLHGCVIFLISGNSITDFVSLSIFLVFSRCVIFSSLERLPPVLFLKHVLHRNPAFWRAHNWFSFCSSV